MCKRTSSNYSKNTTPEDGVPTKQVALNGKPKKDVGHRFASERSKSSRDDLRYRCGSSENRISNAGRLRVISSRDNLLEVGPQRSKETKEDLPRASLNAKVGRKFFSSENCPRERSTPSKEIKKKSSTGNDAKASSRELKNRVVASDSSNRPKLGRKNSTETVKNVVKTIPPLPKCSKQPTVNSDLKTNKGATSKKTFEETSTKRYDLPFNSSTGMCNLHPTIQLAVKNPRG